MRGTLRLRKAIVSLYRDHIVAPGVELEADRLTVSAGCGAILDNLMFLLAGRGDGVLIPVPYYPAFDNDLTARMGVVPVPVATTSGLLPTPEDLERSARAAAGAGTRIRILLLTNPHNPLGVVYPPDRYEALVRWALERGVHVVSDEIYANSVFGEGEEFRSVISMVPGLRKEYGAEVVDRLVHQVWGFSKDFCASGLRVGCLYSGNRQLLATLDNVSYASRAARGGGGGAAATDARAGPLAGTSPPSATSRRTRWRPCWRTPASSSGSSGAIGRSSDCRTKPSRPCWRSTRSGSQRPTARCS